MSSLLSKIATEDCLREAWKNLEKRPESYGLDDICITDFKTNLDNIIKEISALLSSETYKFYPLRLYLKAKGDGSFRAIKIPTVRDRVVQRAIVDQIGPLLDKKYRVNNESSFAYLKDKNVKAAADKIIKLNIAGYRYACKSDIVKFFDRIDRKTLFAMIDKVLPKGNSLMPLIEAAITNDIDNSQYAVYKDRTGKTYIPDTIRGIAQGSPVSPLFANVYLSGFDKHMSDKGYEMVRYADDFAILTNTKAAAKDAYKVAYDFLKTIKLELYPLKDDIPAELWEKDAKYSLARTIQQMEFLGLKFVSGKVYPAGTAYKSIMKNIRTVSTSRRTLIQKLESINSRMLGWCNSYSFTALEPKHIAAMDVALEKVLSQMLTKHGLKKTRTLPLSNILGFSTFKQLCDKVRTKKPSV